MKISFAKTLVCMGVSGWVLLMAGCVSTPGSRVDWSKRVDLYTYKQVVDELGEPAFALKQPDNSVVAEWVVQKRPRLTGPRISSNPDAFIHGQPVPEEEVLIMTFDAKGKLIDCKRVWR